MGILGLSALAATSGCRQESMISNFDPSSTIIGQRTVHFGGKFLFLVFVANQIRFLKCVAFCTVSQHSSIRIDLLRRTTLIHVLAHMQNNRSNLQFEPPPCQAS